MPPNVVLFLHISRLLLLPPLLITVTCETQKTVEMLTGSRQQGVAFISEMKAANARGNRSDASSATSIVQLEALIKAASVAIENFQKEWVEASAGGYKYTNALIDKLTQLQGVTTMQMMMRKDGILEDRDELEAMVASDIRENVVKVDEYLERMTISYAKLARIHGSLRQATDIDLWTKTTNEKKKKEKNNGIYEDVDDDADGPPPPPAVGFYDDNDNKGSNCKNCKLVSTLNDKEKLQNKRKEKEEKEEEEEEEEGVRIVSVSIIGSYYSLLLHGMTKKE
eukprot:jgi/Bigna1/91927/estExt_fgenesh1_pg.C_1310003